MNKAFLERFNNLSIRERSIVLATLLITVWGAWDNFLYQPMAAQQKKLTSELANIQSTLSANQQAATQIEALGKVDPNQANKQKLTQVKQSLNLLKQQLNIGEKKFVPPYLMSKVLQEMITQNHDIKLLKLETLPVTTLSKIDQPKSWVFRHGLSITLSANYFKTLNYLNSLESLPWRFNWESIDYQVKEFPNAETTLRIYTLSFEENWLGL